MFKSSIFSWTHFWGGCNKLSTSHWWSKWPTTRNFCGRHWSTTIPHRLWMLCQSIRCWCENVPYDGSATLGWVLYEVLWFQSWFWHFTLHAICLRISSQCQGEYDPEKGDNLKLGFLIVDLLTVEHPKYWRHLLTSQSKPRGFKSAKYHWQIPSWLLHHHFIPSQNHSESVDAKACLPALYDWECKGYHCMWFRQEENFHFLWLRLRPFYFN